MSGIFRDVTLLHKPTSQINDMHVNTHFNDDFSRAALEAEVRINSDDVRELLVTVQLWQGETLIDEETAPPAVKLLMSAAHITIE